MGIVVASHSMSLDGFIVQARTPGPLHEWCGRATGRVGTGRASTSIWCR